MRPWILTVLSAVGLLFGLIVILSFTGDLRPYKIPTGGMRPTLSPGDHFYMERLSYRSRKPQRGEIVVFRTDGIRGITEHAGIYVQRIIGLPGDKLELRPRGLLVNGREDPALRQQSQ
jgi:signal peptidase I